MNAVIIQARMGSTRFPGKVLAQLGGKTILDRVLSNCHASLADQEIVATSTLDADDEIVQWCKQRQVSWYRGHPENVAQRMLGAAEQFQAKLIVRVCADCPFISPTHINTLLEQWHPGVDYLAFRVGNLPAVMTRVGLPELITVEALRRCVNYAENLCEHVTWACHQKLPVNAQYIDISGVAHQENTVDDPMDLMRLGRLCGRHISSQR